MLVRTLKFVCQEKQVTCFSRQAVFDIPTSCIEAYPALHTSYGADSRCFAWQALAASLGTDAFRGMTTWILYRFTVTAKMGFIYHIPGPDEDPDDPSTNTCPLDPVLENKLNMQAALPKQIFGMLVPKELPDVRTMLPYTLRLPHARDALDCSLDLMGPVSFSKDELEDIKAFHAAMMEGPQKKKDAKKVAEELRRLTDAARKALGELPDADELDPPPKPAEDPKPVPAPQQGPAAATPPSSSPAAAEQGSAANGPATCTEVPPAGHGSPGQPSTSLVPNDTVMQQQQQQQQQASDQQQTAAKVQSSVLPAASQSASPSDLTAAAAAAATQAQQQQQQSGDTDMSAIALPEKAEEAQPEKAGEVRPKDSASQPESSATAADLAAAVKPSKADVDAPQDSAQPTQPNGPVSTNTTADDSNKPTTDEAPKIQDPVHVWDELTRHQEGDNEAFEDKFAHNYFFVPLKLWLDWEDVAAKLPVDPPRELDWDAVRHVKHGWKPLTTLEEVGSQQAAGDSPMQVDGAQLVPTEISNSTPRDQCVSDDLMQPDAPIPSGGLDTPNGLSTADDSTANLGPVTEPAPKKPVKMGPLDPQRLANSVMVTTYNATPYFYEGIDPELTPQSRFPDDKLKLQAVVEHEEEDEFLKPKPPKEAPKPDESPGSDNDKPDESEGVPKEAAAAAAAKTVTVAGRESPTEDTADQFVVRLIASKQAATFTDYFK